MQSHNERFEQALKNDGGELAVDVIELPEELILRTAIAGATGKDLDIIVNSDVITIRGERKEPPLPENATKHHGECYWGPFSRTVVLPAHVEPGKAEAHFERGLITITVPKIHDEKRLTID
jgi:HSP20 family protein